MINDFRQQNQTISNFFAKNLAQYGPNSNLSVVWSSKENQLIRFQALCEIANLDNTSILDVGSGLSDLYSYLNTKSKNITYAGVEISNNHVIEAKKKYPEVDPKTIFDYCKLLTPFVTLRHDYLVHDFTVYLYKSPIPVITRHRTVL